MAENSSSNVSDQSPWMDDERAFWKRTASIREGLHATLVYGTLANVAIGVVFNFLALWFLWPIQRRSNHYRYLMVLAIGDMGNLTFNFLIGASRGVFKEFNDIFVNYQSICIIHSILLDFFCFAPVWTIVCLSLERLIMVTSPLQRNMLFTRTRATRTLSTMYLVFFLWSFHKLSTAGLEAHSSFGYTPCRPIIHPVLVEISTLLWAVIPVFAIFIINILIIRKIRASNFNQSEPIDITTNSSCTSSASHRFHHNRWSKRCSSANRMVLLVSFTYLLLVTPSGLTVLLDTLQNHGVIQQFNNKDGSIFHMARQVSLLLYEVNFSVNFMLYITTDKQFRKRLQHCFQCPRKVKYHLPRSPTLDYTYQPEPSQTHHLVSNREKIAKNAIEEENWSTHSADGSREQYCSQCQQKNKNDQNSSSNSLKISTK